MSEEMDTFVPMVSQVQDDIFWQLTKGNNPPPSYFEDFCLLVSWMLLSTAKSVSGGNANLRLESCYTGGSWQ